MGFLEALAAAFLIILIPVAIYSAGFVLVFFLDNVLKLPFGLTFAVLCLIVVVGLTGVFMSLPV